jgi:hypothetical protein
MAWCQSAESRLCWPGTKEAWNKSGTIYYTVMMNAPGAREAIMRVEEHQRPSEWNGGGASFENGMEWTFATGEVASSWQTYRFVEEERGSRLYLEHRYMMPGNAASRLLHRGRFARSVEKAVQRYAQRLAELGGNAG